MAGESTVGGHQTSWNVFTMPTHGGFDGSGSDRLMASHQWKGCTSRIRFVQNGSPDWEAKQKQTPPKNQSIIVVFWFTFCFWYHYCYTCIYITIYIGVWSCEGVSFEMLLSLQSGCSTPTWGDRHDTHIIIYAYIRFRQLDIHMWHICALCKDLYHQGQSIQRKKHIWMIQRWNFKLKGDCSTKPQVTRCIWFFDFVSLCLTESIIPNVALKQHISPNDPNKMNKQTE